MELQGISTALQQGCKLQAFLSGGGLRVIRLEKGNKLKGYGEHPFVNDALAYADADFLAGGRKYSDVYGKKVPHYLTGSSTPSDVLDLWIRQGRTFDAWWEKGEFVFELQGYQDAKAPPDLYEKVERGGGVEYWENRGFRYEITSTGSGTSMRCLNPRKGADCWMWRIKKIGRGKTFNDAMTNAFRADPVEISQG